MIRIAYRYWFFIVLLACFDSLQAQVTTDREKLPPVLNYVPENEVMALIEAEFALAEVGRNIPTNSSKALRSFRSFKKAHDSLIDAGNNGDYKEFSKAFVQGLSLYTFYMINDTLGSHKARLGKIRSMNYKLGEWVFLKAQSASEKKRVRILQLAMGLGQPAYLSDSIAKIIDLQKDADPKFEIAIKLLLYYNLQSSPSTVGSANQIISDVKTKLNSRQSVLADLIKIDAEITNQLDKAGTAQGDRSKLLYAVSQKAQKIPEEGLRWRINGTILHLWLAGVQNPDWRQAPLVEVKNGGRGLIMPVSERIVIEDIASGDLKKGISIYAALAKQLRSQVISIELDQRYLLLVRDLTTKNGNFEFQDKVLNELVQRYKKGNTRFKKPYKKAHYVFFLEYRRFLQALLEKALTDGSTEQFRARVTKIAAVFAQSYQTNRNDILTIKQLLADLFQKQGRHKEAVAEYLDLAKDRPIKNYDLAAQSQKILARWPVAPPWGKIPQGDRGERATLIAIYQAKIKAQISLKRPRNWSDLAHLGLLYAATGQLKALEGLWLPELPAARPDTNVNGASGILLANFFKQKRWTDFINLARLTEKKKILPTLEQKVLDVAKFYQVALYQRSTQNQKAGNLKDAIKDQEEIIKRYPRDPKRPAYILETARMYQKNKQTADAMSAITLLVREYANHALTKQGLLEGGEWGKNSRDKSILEAASEFYRIFVDSFPTDKLLPVARYERAGVLMKLKQYPLASQYLKLHAQDRRVTPLERVKAALLHIGLEDKYGDGSRAVAGLVPVLNLAKPQFGEDIYLSCHIILARIATEKVNIQEMAKEEKILAPFIQKRADIGEVLGYLRLTAANHYDYEIPFPSQAYGIDSYKPAVASIQKAFAAVKRAYLRVCLPRPNRYCESTYGRLKQYAQDTIDALEAMQLSGQIQANMITVLQKYQQDALVEIRKDKKNFDEKFDEYRISNERK